MGHVYKPSYTRPIPAGAEHIVHDGVPAVRWKARGGKYLVGVILETDPKRCRCVSPSYRIAYSGPGGEKCDELAYPDKAASEALLAERVRTSARVNAGLLPAEAMGSTGARAVTLTELLAEWGRHLRDAGRSAKHCRDRPLLAGRVVEAAQAHRVADLTPARVTGALAKVRTRFDLSARTVSYHLSAVKQFTRWLVHGRRSETTDHLSGLSCKLARSEPTFTRRSLTGDEFARLLSKTARGGPFRGLTGVERAALYLTAARTGLRVGELAALTPEAFDLDGETPTVLARAEHAKGGKTTFHPLNPDVVEALRPLLAAVEPGARVWPHRIRFPEPYWSPWSAWWLEAAEMMRHDLAAAGLAWETGEGVYDAHALRGQFATDCERGGVHPFTTQRAMRHSTPTLTSKHYLKRGVAEMASELRKIRPVKRGRKK